MEENTTNITTSIDIQNVDGIEYLKTINKNSIDLILTDPPYIISKDSGMNSHYNKVKENAENNIEFVKTEEDWKEYKEKNKMENDDKKDNYMRYGSIYGTKYCVKTDYGVWDSEFTLDKLEEFISIYYDKLKKPSIILKIDFGKDIGIKKSSAQIRENYDSDNLINKQIIAVVNFKPKQIGNIVSEVLVLALPDENNEPILLSPPKKLENGIKLY